MAFSKQLNDAQPHYRLASFDAPGIFVSAAKEGYGKLLDAFLKDRSRGGSVPEVDDYDIRKEFVEATSVDSHSEMEAVDVEKCVATVLAALDRLLPEAEAENEINAQLAKRVWDGLNLEYQEFVSKGGKVVLTNRAWIDSTTKKYSQRNDYCYSCEDQVRKQIVVMQEMVVHFNAEHDKCYSTRMPSWQELQNATRGLTRSPTVLHVMGADLKFRISSYEWHLTQEFAGFLSEFISLHLRR